MENFDEGRLSDARGQASSDGASGAVIASPSGSSAFEVVGEAPSRLKLIFSRPWAMAVLYLVIAVLLAAIGWSGLWNIFSLLELQASPWYSLITAVPACGAVLLKGRSPALGLVLALVIFFADLATVGGLVPLLVVLELMHAYLLTLNALQRKRALGGIVTLLAGTMLAVFVFTNDLRLTAMLALQFGALFGFAYWYANSIAQSHELVRLYRQRGETAERLADFDREAAVQGERDRMARELHDIVAGHISAVAIRSEAALSAGVAMQQGEPSSEREALLAVRDSSLEAHAALRSMIRVLRSGSPEFEVPPGRTRLPELVAAANESGVSVTLVDEINADLSVPIDQAVGRVVQEALANSVRHSSGSEVEVWLGEVESELHIEVISRGGSALSSLDLSGSGMGLELLTERVRALGGTLIAGAGNPDGCEMSESRNPGRSGGSRNTWTVRARLPIGENL